MKTSVKKQPKILYQLVLYSSIHEEKSPANLAVSSLTIQRDRNIRAPCTKFVFTSPKILLYCLSYSGKENLVPCVSRNLHSFLNM